MRQWRTEFNRLGIILLGAGILGLLFDEFMLALLLALAAYSLLNIIQYRRLYIWLAENQSGTRSPPPESFGLWGDVFDGFYRIQKQERAASAFLENIINKAQESSAALEIGVIMINKENNLDWWNLASERFLGLQYPQDRNQSVTNLIRNPDFAEYYQKEHYDETLKIEAPGDSRKVLEFQIALFGEHERLIVVRDITQLLRLENMRTDFIGNVSHELGTPITVIKGYLEAMLDNLDEVDDKWRKPLKQMRQQSLRMENIVRDLLMLSSLETKTLPKQQDEISVHELFSEIESDTQQIFLDKSHKFEIHCGKSYTLTGKRSELYSAVSNLVVNAAKYTPENGVIKLTAALTKDSFNIEVEDNGIGIERHHLPRLTERFYRVDVSRSADTGGTGLGLAIVKHILIRHDAELEIDSKFNRGSRFICKFPLTRYSTEGASQDSTEETESDTG